jgi:cytochrome P450
MPESAVIDLSDPDLFRAGGHHAAFAALRANDPVYWNPVGERDGFWALTRYADIVAAYRQHDVFSSANGAIMGGSYRSATDTSSGRMLVATDLPRHRLLRQQVQRVFAPRFIEAARRQAYRLVDDALAKMEADGGGDFAQDVAVELAAGALIGLLDIGHADARHLVALTRRMADFRAATSEAGQAEARLALAATQTEIFAFFDELVEDRMDSPGDDLVGILTTARVNGQPLSREDVLYNCLNVAVGGNETSSHTAAAGLQALMDNPDQYDRLLNEEALLPTAMDEILRWTSIAAYVQRMAQRDVVVRDRTIKAGDTVTLWNVSGNRDPEQFPDPDRLLLDRRPNRHLSYGTGVHRCVGANLGQVEVSIAFDLLRRRRLRLRPAGPAGPFRSNFILGVRALPVTVATAAGSAAG